MKKMNNKGFSLVELIIVIAIMAILVGVLAPQYIKFVEKSKISTDKDNIGALIDAVHVCATEGNITGVVEYTVETTGTTGTGTNSDKVEEYIGSLTKIKLSSSKWAAGGVYVKYDASDNSILIKDGGSSGTTISDLTNYLN